MAAPEYVPRPAAEHPRVYESPPRRLGSWTNDRPGDFVGPQPVGPGLGNPGPDQGYVLKLAREFEGQLVLTDGEHEEDAVHGCITVALKRASLFRRAPVIHDLTVAFSIWGFLAEPPADLVALRGSLFEEVRQPHHYLNKRLIADAVPAESLRLTPAQVQQQVSADWRQLVVDPRSEGAGSLLVVDDFSTADIAPPPPPAPVVEEVAVEEVAVEEVAVEEVAVEEVAVEEVAVVEDVEPLPERAPTADPPLPPPTAPAAPVSSMNTADITELAAEAKRALRNAPTAPGGPVPGVDVPPTDVPPTDEAPPTDEVPDVEEHPDARRAAKPVAIPKDAEPDEVARLVAEAKQAFRRKPAADAGPTDGATDGDDDGPEA